MHKMVPGSFLAFYPFNQIPCQNKDILHFSQYITYIIHHQINVSTLIWYIWRPAEHMPKVVKVLIVVLRQHAHRRLS